jgi:hypothetical protein
MKKESFIIYKSFYQPIRNLQDQQLGALFRALFEYQIEEKEPNWESDISMAFQFFKNQFSLDQIKYEKVVERNQMNGKKGGRPTTQGNPNNPMGSSKPKQPDNVNDNDNVTVTVNEKETVNTIEVRKLAFAESIKPYIGEFEKPMLLEFFEYWAEHGERDKKMRFEKQTSFAISRRIKTWSKNQNKFNKPTNNKSAGKVDDEYIQELKDRLS